MICPPEEQPELKYLEHKAVVTDAGEYCNSMKKWNDGLTYFIQCKGLGMSLRVKRPHVKVRALMKAAAARLPLVVGCCWVEVYWLEVRRWAL